MVEFVIKELGISEAGAKVVRENPEHFMIDFELFNLLKFK